jgi:hypothetical protein
MEFGNIEKMEISKKNMVVIPGGVRILISKEFVNWLDTA